MRGMPRCCKHHNTSFSQATAGKAELLGINGTQIEQGSEIKAFRSHPESRPL